MKKIFSALALCAGTVVAVAQSDVKTGIEAGITSTGIKSIEYNGAAAGTKSTYNNETGFYVGAIAHINASKGFSFQSGIKFVSTKAAEKLEVLGTPNVVRGTVSMNQVEIPLNLVFRPAMSKNKCFQKLSMYFGPQIAVAVSGETNFRLNGGANTKTKLEFGNGATQYKRLQTYWAGGIGYQFSKSLALNAAYHFGWSDIDNSDNFVTGFNSLRFGIRYTLK
jgi:hypothetical protein